jgi:prevent-host-death family protein
MAIKTVGMHEAKTQLSRLVRDLEGGDEVVITRGGTPVARLVAPEPVRSVAASRGMFKGQIWMSDDFDDDGDEMARLFGIVD